jgi:hypothetical protein
MPQNYEHQAGDRLGEAGVDAVEQRIRLNIPYRCDGPLKYGQEIATFVEGGIHPEFVEMKNHLCDIVAKESGGFWIVRSTAREGVTTLLWQVEEKLGGETAEQGIIPVYVDCFSFRAKEKGHWTAEEAFLFLAHMIQYEAQDRDPQFNVPIAAKGEGITPEEFTAYANNTAALGKKVVLMLDEATVLQESEGGQPYVAGLSGIYQTLGELATQPRDKGGFFVMVDSRPGFDGWNDISLTRLQEIVPQAQTLRLPLYSLEDIEKLATLLPQIKYDPESYRRIGELSGGNPALTQTIFYYIAKEAQDRTLKLLSPGTVVTREIVDEIIRKRLCRKEAAPYFVFAVFCSLTKEQISLVRRLVRGGRLNRETFAITGKRFTPQDLKLLSEMEESRMIRRNDAENRFFAQGVLLWALPLTPHGR